MDASDDVLRLTLCKPIASLNAKPIDADVSVCRANARASVASSSAQGCIAS
jgi:hypothetical protein